MMDLILFVGASDDEKKIEDVALSISTDPRIDGDGDGRKPYVEKSTAKRVGFPQVGLWSRSLLFYGKLNGIVNRAMEGRMVEVGDSE